MHTIVFYISGHGFGHAARDIEVINALLAERDDLRIIARTSAAKWLFERTVAPAEAGARVRHSAGLGPEIGRQSAELGPQSAEIGRHSARRGVRRVEARPRFSRVEAVTDTGAVQIDALHLDEERTIARAREFMRTFEARVASETAFLCEHDARLVVADIPALGVAAARRAGIPAVGFGNFTWDWIYASYTGSDDVVQQIGEAYAAAAVALRLPMHGGFATFPRIRDLPFVARRSGRDAEATRRALAFPTDRRLVLVSFGGYGIGHIRQDALDSLRDYAVIGSARYPLDEDAMYASGFRYEDVVRSVDVVVTKPGYGILSECIANDTALLYTSRGRFAEYDVFVREMPRYLRARFISHDELFSGEWQQHLDGLLAQSEPPERPALNGAEIAAQLLLDMI